uniref:Phenazine biosynthesis PhzC/PhzF protein n=1 Tax=Mycena chlorophos TaxID=658473 RepID=A0ABQ0LPF8_MYCCL|nr:predicted protein [Mycena chlorophos]
MTTLAYTVYDAFTARRFGGNPASVIVLDRDHGLSDETLQLIGRAFNPSETTFLVPLEDHTNEAPHFSLRWFTPQSSDLVPPCRPRGYQDRSEDRTGFLVEVAESVASVQYNASAIAAAADLPIGQCVITAPHTPIAEDPSQVHSRMFAPGRGIKEDPVTGSAHTRIVPHWLNKFDGDRLLCRQVSARVGELDTVWLREEGRVLLRGKGVKVAEGTLFI